MIRDGFFKLNQTCLVHGALALAMTTSDIDGFLDSHPEQDNDNGTSDTESEGGGLYWPKR